MKKINSNGQIIGGAAEMLDSIENVREFVVNYLDGEYIKNHVSSSIAYGYKAFENYRLFVESPRFSTNNTGKWTLVLYSNERGFDEMKRIVVGGANRVNSWEKVAEIARQWVIEILDEMRDEIVGDVEWEQIMDESEYIGNEMAILESAIDDADSDITKTIDETKDTIDGLADVDWWELDDDGIKNQITENCHHIALALNDLAQARENFLKRISDYTGCDFGFGDAYSDEPVVDIYPYYSEIGDFNATDAFEQIIGYIFEYPTDHYQDMDGAEDLLSLRDTLFHYLAVA